VLEKLFIGAEKKNYQNNFIWMLPLEMNIPLEIAVLNTDKIDVFF